MGGERQIPAVLLSALLALVAGCGKIEKNAPSGAVQAELGCDAAPPPGELSQLSEDSRNVAMGPCGELSYVVGTQAFLVEASLSAPEPLEGGIATANFDPLGRGLFYLADADTALVYRDLRGASSWSSELPPLSTEDARYEDGDKPLRPIDFYAKGPASAVFRCQGTTLYDYDEAGQASAHDLGFLCPRTLHSVADALLVGPTLDGYRGVKLGGWQSYPLEAAGVCAADRCDFRLTRKVLSKDLFAYRAMGDTFVPVAQGSQSYDAETGAEVGAGALTTPDHGVVVAGGSVLLLDDQRTLAVTAETGSGEANTTVRYFGPNPGQPERWLTSSFTLEPSRGSLHALSSDDLQRIAIWSETCEGARRTLLTFAPGHDPALLDVAGCISKVHWVGSDGTLLAEVRDSDTSIRLALIYPDQRVAQLELELSPISSVRQAASDGRALAITTGYAGPLYLIDLETAATRELSPTVEQMFTDRARKRLAFRVWASSSGDPRPLWAGAFPH